MSEAMIVRDPTILVGKPTIRGTRISVELILDCLASGMSHAEILEAYPHLRIDQIVACLQYARDHLPPAQWRLFKVHEAAE